MDLTVITYPQFMKACLYGYSHPSEDAKCKECGDRGLVAITCCSGHECGCMGMPTDFDDCTCGAEFPTDEQLKEWFEKATEPPQ